MKYYLIDTKGKYTDKKYTFMYYTSQGEDYVKSIAESMHMKDITIHDIPKDIFDKIAIQEGATEMLKFKSFCCIGEW